MPVRNEWHSVATRFFLWTLALLLCMSTLLHGVPAQAAGTPAGTIIDNTAQVDFEIAGTNVSLNSNTVSITVDERIDVVVTLQSPQVLVDPGDVDRSLLFTLTNTGNGIEDFQLAIDSIIGGDDFDPVPVNTGG